MADKNETVGENTYLIETSDPRINTADFARLCKQDEMLNNVSGLFPQEHVLPSDAHILDVCCGPAGWIRSVFAQHPDAHLTGIDNNRKAINYARSFVTPQNQSHISFELMNVLDHPWHFPDASFDFVNARLCGGVIPNRPENQWIPLMEEYYRVLKPGGMVRLMECEIGIMTYAPAAYAVADLLLEFMWQRGLSFSRHANAITPMLPKFLADAGFHQIKQQAWMFDWSPGQDLHESMAADTKMAIRILREPLRRLRGLSVKEFEDLYQRMEAEIEDKETRAVWPFVSVCARKPS